MAMLKNKKNLIFTKTFSCAVLPGACTMALRLNARTSAPTGTATWLGSGASPAASSVGVVGVLVSLVERRDAQVNVLIGQVQVDRQLLATH